MKVIDCYTRKQAIEDGQLHDISKMAKETGFKCPVAVTSGVMSVIKDIPEKYKWQDVEGRTWDVLTILFWKAKKSNRVETLTVTVKLPHTVTRIDEKSGKETKVQKLYAEFKAVAGPGDEGELVITIMLPNED